MSLSLLSQIADLVKIASFGLGVLKEKPDPRIEHVLTDRTDREKEWVVLVVVSNHGKQEAKRLRCVAVVDRGEYTLKYPMVETPRGAIYSLEEFSLAAGAVKVVRGYVQRKTQNEGAVVLISMSKGEQKETDKVPLPYP